MEAILRLAIERHDGVEDRRGRLHRAEPFAFIEDRELRLPRSRAPNGLTGGDLGVVRSFVLGAQ